MNLVDHAKLNPPGSGGKMKRKPYEDELRKLQVELCHVQDWVQETGARVLILFEGRDTAGKGGLIRVITERVSPRTFRRVALSAPDAQSKKKLFLQRYIEHFPAAGEIVLFDRSWYNRAGVDNVMGFATKQEVEGFLAAAPQFEEWLVQSGIILIKLWLEVGKKEQDRRLKARIEDPLRQWKLSPLDLKSYTRWYDYSKARDDMFKATDRPHARWHVLRSDDKRRARLNGIAHILSLIPYKPIKRDKPHLPKRSNKKKYDDRLDPLHVNLVPETF